MGLGTWPPTGPGLRALRQADLSGAEESDPPAPSHLEVDRGGVAGPLLCQSGEARVGGGQSQCGGRLAPGGDVRLVVRRRWWGGGDPRVGRRRGRTSHIGTDQLTATASLLELWIDPSCLEVGCRGGRRRGGHEGVRGRGGEGGGRECIAFVRAVGSVVLGQELPYIRPGHAGEMLPGKAAPSRDEPARREGGCQAAPGTEASRGAIARGPSALWAQEARLLLIRTPSATSTQTKGSTAALHPELMLSAGGAGPG